MKRSFEEESAREHKKHKHKHDHSNRKHFTEHADSERQRSGSKNNDTRSEGQNNQNSRQNNNDLPSLPHPAQSGTQHDADQPSKKKDKSSNNKQHPLSHESALAQLPPPTSASTTVPPYVPYPVPTTLPPLPPLAPSGPLSTAPFKHKSTTTYNRSTTTSTADLTYERLEFLGDAYIELIASRLIFARFPHLPVGAQSQLRELLVKNETLAEYSRAYGFEHRVEAAARREMEAQGRGRGNKGFNKVLGDVFEAYVAAVVLADEEHGFAVVEKWLTTLWAPKLLHAASDPRNAPGDLALTHPDSADKLKIYNPLAKQELQKRILRDSSIKLSYEPYKDPVELKGDRLGQTTHFIALYLTGWGYERELLGQGEGRNKVEAGNWAATQAMWGAGREVVERCEELWRAEREKAKGGKGEQGG